MLRQVRVLVMVVMGGAALSPPAAFADAGTARTVGRATAAGTARISGHITAANGTAITAYGVCAYAYSYDINAYPNTTSLVAVRAAGRDGSYELTRLSPASYVVGFGDCHPAPGTDAAQYAPGVTDVSSGHQYVLRAGQSVTRVDAKLQPGASISGHVTGAMDSHPLRGICVNAMSFGIVSGPLAPVRTTTAADGSYMLSHLPAIAPAGSYSLTFTDCNSQSVYLDPPASGPLSPTPGQPVTGADAQLQVGASISGHVTDAHGQRVRSPTICVSAEPSDYLHRGPPNTDASTKIDGSGQYRLGGLVGDTYDVRFQDCRTSANLRPGERNDATVIEQVAVSDGHTATHDETLTPGATIRGRVYAGPGSATPAAGACVRVTTRQSSYSVHAPYLDETVTTDARGAYTLGHLAPATARYVGGAWLVSFANCQPPYDTTWYDGTTDISNATALHLTVGQSFTGADGHLPARSGTRNKLVASMTTTLYGLLRPVGTAVRGWRTVGPWRLPATSAGTWSVRVTRVLGGRNDTLVVFRGGSRLLHAGRARLVLRLTHSGGAWLRTAAARRALVRLHALLTFDPAGRAGAVSVSTDLTIHPR